MRERIAKKMFKIAFELGEIDSLLRFYAKEEPGNFFEELNKILFSAEELRVALKRAALELDRAVLIKVLEEQQ